MQGVYVLDIACEVYYVTYAESWEHANQLCPMKSPKDSFHYYAIPPDTTACEYEIEIFLQWRNIYGSDCVFASERLLKEQTEDEDDAMFKLSV